MYVNCNRQLIIMNHIIQLIDRGDKGDDQQSLQSNSMKKISKTNPKLFKDAASYYKHIKIRELLATAPKPTDVKVDDNYMYTMRKKHYMRGHSLIVPGMELEPHPKGSAPIIIKLRASSPLTPSRASLISPTTTYSDMQSNEYREERPSSRISGSGWRSRATSEMIQNSGRVSKPVVLFRAPLRFITYGNTAETVSPTMRAKTAGLTQLPSPIRKQDIGVTTMKGFFIDPLKHPLRLPKAVKTRRVTFSREPFPLYVIDYDTALRNRRNRPICRQQWT